MASSPASTGARREVPPPFGRIVCGTDGSRSAHLAVEQAIALSGPATALVFVCVREACGVGRHPPRDDHRRARRPGSARGGRGRARGGRRRRCRAPSGTRPAAGPARRSVSLGPAGCREPRRFPGRGHRAGATASAAVHRASCRCSWRAGTPRRHSRSASWWPPMARGGAARGRAGRPYRPPAPRSTVYLLGVEPLRTATPSGSLWTRSTSRLSSVWSRRSSKPPDTRPT